MSMHVTLRGVQIKSIALLKRMVNRMNNTGYQATLTVNLVQGETPSGTIQLKINDRFSIMIRLRYVGEKPAVFTEDELLNGRFEMTYDGDFRSIVEPVIGENGSKILTLFNREKAFRVAEDTIMGGTTDNTLMMYVASHEEAQQHQAALEAQGFQGYAAYFYEMDNKPKLNVVDFTAGSY